MSSVRYLVLALSAAPVGVLPAQTARTRAPVVVRVPDLSWLELPVIIAILAILLIRTMRGRRSRRGLAEAAVEEEEQIGI